MRYDLKVYEKREGYKECETIRGLTYAQCWAIEQLLDRQDNMFKWKRIDVVEGKERQTNDKTKPH